MVRETRETREGPTRAPEREREVIVTDRGRSSGVGAAIAAIIGIIVVGLIAWFLFVGFGGGEAGDSEINVDVPEEVDVNQNDGGDGGGS